MSANLAVIILTFNEEKNIAQALRSVCGWAREVFLVDSYSTDETVAIANSYPCQVFQNHFENYALQRNWALDILPIRSEWIFFLDADEWMPGNLRDEVSSTIADAPLENGFYIRPRVMWMGRWIRRGYYPTWLLRLFRHKTGRCEDREINEHIVVSGAVGRLKNDLIHEDCKPLGAWIEKHNRYAKKEAAELFKENLDDRYVQARLFGGPTERKRWLHYKIYNRLPPLIRPPMYFVYRYLFRGGFLDGRAALIYHFLQALWFPLLIDLNYLEMKKQLDGGYSISDRHARDLEISKK